LTIAKGDVQSIPGRNEMLTETKGDLFDYVGKNPNKVIYIPHVVNSYGAWGAGFVLAVSKYYKDAESRYRKVAEHKSLKLGRTHYIPCKNHNDLSVSYRNVIICNMCAQELGGKRPLYYNHLATCMDDVANFILSSEDKTVINEIMCPKFGSALAGGNWEFIKELIHDCWVRRGLTVKVFYL
jgi:hypothetical protein